MSRKIFESFGGRRVEGNFEGGKITSDAGGLLLSEVESRFEILKQFAACFTDYRNPLLTEHMLEELLGQRVYGLALGPRWSGRSVTRFVRDCSRSARWFESACTGSWC